MRHSVICIGEAMVEISPSEGFDSAGLGFAGDTFNTSWYLAKLAGADLDVHFATSVGQDALSDRFVDLVEGAGVSGAFITRHLSRSMGLYMIHLSKGERSFSYWRSASAARDLAAEPEALARLVEAGTVLYLSGITLAILDGPGLDRLETCLTAARLAGKTVVLDTNLRPRLWETSDQMCETIMRFARIADMALPSFDDEALYFGDTDPKATLDRYAQAGPGLVVVKNGAEEVLTRSAEGDARHAVTPVSQIVDTTAAGDSFNAGFLAAHLTGKTLAEAVQTGAAVARQVIQGPGALVEIDFSLSC